MADKMLKKLIPEDRNHKGKCFFFDDDGTLYYGKDGNNLYYPDVYDDIYVLPPITLKDLRNAFLLGKETGN